ncbi:MAG: aryl-sulfate sulfotransferase, partial [Bacteroidales bacterium]
AIFQFQGDKKKKFIEYAMTGKEVNNIILDAYYFDHDFTELPNGNLLVLCSKNANAPKIEDHIIIVDRISGMVLKEYNLAEVLDDQRLLGYFPDEANDWFHHNSVYYSQEDNSMIISGRHQGIVKVGVGDGKLKWILAPHKAWGVNKPELPNYLLKAVDASGNPYANNIQEGDEKSNSFDWTWGQHNVILTKTGNLLCFDNGTHRNFLGGALNVGYDPNSYSRIVEYKFDEVNKTVRQVWQYGADTPEYLSGAISGVQDLDNGNRLMCPGAIGLSDGSFIAKIIELNPKSNEKVFECTYYLKGAAWNQVVYRSKREMLY